MLSYIMERWLNMLVIICLVLWHNYAVDSKMEQNMVDLPFLPLGHRQGLSTSGPWSWFHQKRNKPFWVRRKWGDKERYISVVIEGDMSILFWTYQDIDVPISFRCLWYHKLNQALCNSRINSSKFQMFIFRRLSPHISLKKWPCCRGTILPFQTIARLWPYDHYVWRYEGKYWVVFLLALYNKTILVQWDHPCYQFSGV